MKKNILLTGLPGVGKTTIVIKIVEMLESKCGGFYTKEIRKDNKRIGFKLVTLDGKECIIAHKEINSSCRVGRYGISLDCIDNFGVKSIEDAIIERRIVIIDEIGKMELYSQRFRKAVLAALNSKCPVLATIIYSANPFCDRLKERKDVEIVEVTVSNRNSLVQRIIDMLF